MIEEILPTEGPAAPPRANGELLFSAPWQSRVFGLTLALHEAGAFRWAEFQEKLIEAIGAHEKGLERSEAATSETPGYDYYGCWLEAFEALAIEKAWLDASALGALQRELLARPAGHDHR